MHTRTDGKARTQARQSFRWMAFEMSELGQVTDLLHAWAGGDASALERLTPLVYAELRRMAAGYLRRERKGHTLQSTDLVHEAFLRLVRSDRPDFSNRAHFLAIAGRLMRQILVDHARSRGRLKRGGAQGPMPVTLANADVAGAQIDMISLDDAIQGLTALDPRKARILEMHFFGGMTQDEIASVLCVHVNTTARDLRLARAWLQARLS